MHIVSLGKTDWLLILGARQCLFHAWTPSLPPPYTKVFLWNSLCLLASPHLSLYPWSSPCLRWVALSQELQGSCVISGLGRLGADLGEAGGRGLHPECVRRYLNFPVVRVLSPFSFVSGEQLSSAMVHPYCHPGCGTGRLPCPGGRGAASRGVLEPDRLPATCQKALPRPLSPTAVALRSLSPLHTGDNAAHVGGSGRACTSHPLGHGTGEGHVGASNGLD